MESLFDPSKLGDYNYWEWVFLHHPRPWEWWLVGIGLVVAVVLTWKNLARIQSNKVRWALFALRVALAVLLVLLWLEPAAQLQKRLTFKSHVVVLADRSRSMDLPSAPGEPSRAEKMADFFANSREAFAELAEHHHLHAMTFGTKTSTSSLDTLSQPLENKEDYTSLLASVKSTAEGFPSEELAGIVVVTDGVDNPPEHAATDEENLLQLLEKKNLPIVAYGVGVDKGLADLAIRDVRYDGFAFVHNEMAVEIEIGNTGYKERDVNVTLALDGAPIQAKTVRVAEGERRFARFTFAPEKVGQFVYEARIDTPPEDAIAENDSRKFIVQVIRDKIRILHVCGHPDYDEMFLRRHLKRNPSVDLISFFILRTPEDSVATQDNELSLIPFPTEELFDKQLHTFDLVIFQNFTYVGYRMAHFLPNIRNYVEQGGALLVIGGDVSYGLGGYRHTAIEHILPFTIEDDAGAASLEPFSARLTTKGERHPVTRLVKDLDANRQAWNDLPELLGLNLGLKPRPDAMVLAVHPRLSTAYGSPPVIALREPGKGRVLALTVDSTWVWNFQSVGRGERAEHYRTFWNNSLRWLIKDPELTHVQATPAKDSYRPGENVGVSFRITDAGFQPKAGAQATIEARFQGENKIVFKEEKTSDEEGIIRTTLPAPDKEGLLEVRLVHRLEDGEEQRGEAMVFIEGKSREMDEVSVDFRQLERLAKASGGRFEPLPDRMDEPIEFEGRHNERIGAKQDIPIWDNAVVLGLIVFLAAVEWWWRKRRRLP